VNENCLAVILKKLPEKLGDPDKFLIPCNFPELVECLALTDLGASFNLMPLSIWEKLSLTELTPTQMILELVDRWTTRPAGIVEDIFVKVGKFHFSTDFVVVDCVVDPRLVRSMFKKYSDSHNFLKVAIPLQLQTPLLLSLPPLSLLLREETSFWKTCLASESIPPGIDNTKFDPERDILLIEKLLNDDPLFLLPLKELNLEELKSVKSSIDEPPELELKDLPSHFEYAFLEGADKVPVIITKNIKDDKKACLLKVLKSHKRAIAWKLSDIKGIDPQFCTYKILMEDDFKPAVQHQRRVNLKIHEVIKKKLSNSLMPD
nr:DNA-directed DNA polymerase [Tanacetum cinerariifolium]